MLPHHPADNGPGVPLQVAGALQLVGELAEFLGGDGVEHDVGAGDGDGRAQGAEFEFIPRKGEGGGAVAVGGVHVQVGQHVDAGLQGLALHPLVGAVLLDGLQNAGELVPQEHGDDSGRRLAGPQAVVVARGCHGDAQQVLILVHALDDRGQQQQEPQVLAGVLAGVQQVHAGVRGQGPVVVLAAAVDPLEGLLVEQTHQPVAGGHVPHHLHGELVVVGGHIGGGEDGGQFVLGGGHLVVLCFRQDAQLPQLLVQLLHKGGDSRFDGPEIVVLQLLALGGLGPEQGAAAEHQVLAALVELPVHQEVLLFGAHRGDDPLGGLVAENAQDAQGLAGEVLHRAQQGGLLVQHLPAVGAERRGDVEGVPLHESVGGGVPGGVAPGLEGSSKAAAGEGGGVGLALDQLFAGKLHDDPAVGGGGDEAVVLLRGNAV